MNPVFSQPGQRRRRRRPHDNLMWFWFSHVFPHQAALNAGHDVGSLYDQVIVPSS
jgi:hypothetical protein